MYSHSRLSTFEQCQLKFKFAYIDQLETEIEESVESFLGSRVHEVFEKLYTDLKFKKIPTHQELTEFYNTEWKKNWNDDIIIVREEYTQENYRQLGEQYISDYYKRYHPFDQERTVALEKHIIIKLDEKHIVQGYIDRLASKENGVYVIHDYKTSGSLPEASHIEEDRQLALYAMAVKQDYQDCKKVILIWHYLAFDKEFSTEKTDEQLRVLRKDILKLIDQIEATTEYPAHQSALCDWCEFQPECPQFKHLFNLEKKETNEFLKDTGVDLVNKYAHLKNQIEKLEIDIEKLREALLTFAQKESVEVIYGSDMKASVKSYPKLSFPKKYDSNREAFEKIIKQLGLWEQLATVDVYELAKMINNNELYPDLIKLIMKFVQKDKTVRISLSKR
jgi:putative RecB family exonuclease